MIQNIPHPIEILFGKGISLACGLNGELHAESLHGLFAGDTRVLSTYRFAIADHAWQVLARSRVGLSSIQWDMQNQTIRTSGEEIAEGSIQFRLRRVISGAFHDDLSVCSYVADPLAVRFSLLIDADFADIFQVKDNTIPPRLNIRRIPRADGVSFIYERGDFRRAIHIFLKASDGAINLVGSKLVFDLKLQPCRPWTCCLYAVPEIDGRRLLFQGDPHRMELPHDEPSRLKIDSDELLATAVMRGCEDLGHLAIKLKDDEPSFIAGGAPWFLTLFGRDTLVTSLMAGLLGSWHMRGALSALSRLQARERDDSRDAQPGKLPHEIRFGELAHFHDIPHTPYYGTHDAPALYALALWNAFRWTGDRELLRRYLPTARAALQWCQTDGDPDHDGLLEYITHSKGGYLNQGWKDAGDAIPHIDGSHARPPISTVELQGYLYAAYLAMAELLRETGDTVEADKLQVQARSLRALVEDKFWMDDEGCYALALDRDKRLVRSVSSNPGHLLWCGLPSPERARCLAARLLQPDMFSGYGVRTLSSRHRCYNPLSYQLGSVWPHDNALLAAGLMRYGLRNDAARIIQGILEAAKIFEENRLPELFCGLPRADGAPVPYLKANVPQAWAAAVPLLAAQLFLGLIPDVPRRRCYIQPWLPDWLPYLAVGGVTIGDGELEMIIWRDGSRTRIERQSHPTIEIIEQISPAPLWGLPD